MNRNGPTIILPDEIKIELVNQYRERIFLPNVLLGINLYSKRKNNFTLLPFVSDNNGIITITRDEIEKMIHEIIEAYPMDYNRIDDVINEVEIYLLENSYIEQRRQSLSKPDLKTKGKLEAIKQMATIEVYESFKKTAEKIKKRNERLLTIYSKAKLIHRNAMSKIVDIWDGRAKIYNYKISADI